MRGLPSGGMRALPGPSNGGGGGSSYGGGYGHDRGPTDVQPGLWILPLAGLVLLNGGAWLLDQLTAAWCHFEGADCASTHYLPALLHIYAITLTVLAGLIAATVGYRRGWHVMIARLALISLAVLVWGIRRRRARRAVDARRRATTVHATVLTDEDVIDVEAEDVFPAARALPAKRVEAYTVDRTIRIH